MLNDSRNLKPIRPFVVALALAALGLVGVSARGLAGLIPGGGNARSDCYIEMDVAGVTVPSSVVRNNKIVDCTDGDACDQGACGDDQCNFGLRPCINQTDPNLPECTPPASLERARIKGRLNVEIPQLLQGSVCGALLDVPVEVKIKRNGTKKPGQLKYTMIAKAPAGTSPRKETDKNAKLRCLPRTAACSTSTTTTTTTSTTTTTLIVPANCCNFTSLSFTTGTGSGNCGQAVYADGTLSQDLSCGGLYFGGGANTVPLPAAVPDMGNSRLTIAGCDPVSGNQTYAARTAAQTGSNRNCTDTGCLFGAPLPIPNPNSIPTSTCVVNNASAPATGGGNCASGSSSVNLPLNSQIYLTGDLLAGTTCIGGANNGNPCTTQADCPGAGAYCPTGIQACPICVSSTCHGGSNDGMACAPETGALNEGYPTSHDCPPSPLDDIGGIPIPFALSTGTVSDVGVPSTPTAVQDLVFCGFCRDNTTLGFGICDGGTRVNLACRASDLSPTGCPPGPTMGVFCQGQVPCTTNADCSPPFDSCQQRTEGAFSDAAVKTVTLIGTPAGDVTDGMPHPATLVSIFCIPPTFNPTVDNAGDLPGPGGVALPGTAQVFP